MKRVAALSFMMVAGFCMCHFNASSQQADSLPVYKKFPFIPSFQLMKTDSSLFYMKDAVPKNHAAVVIIFSPGCSHCRHQAEEITGHIQAFKDVEFLFATGYPISEMSQYISDYGLDKFPNILVGHDKGLNLGSFYQIKGLPGIFLYNKKGKLVGEFTSNVTAGMLTEALKK